MTHCLRHILGGCRVAATTAFVLVVAHVVPAGAAFRVVQAQVAEPRPAASAAEKAAEIEEFRRGALRADTPGLREPVKIKDAHPAYTPEAMRARLQGSVELELVVMPDGTVGRARIVRGLDPGLDASALSAVKKWIFTPGTLSGAAVAVLCEATLSFTLR
jgi:periplasmic protein TonB